MSQEKISPVAVGMALKSLRNSDFNTESAICEVIDNSLQAHANEIKIKISYPDKSTNQRNRPDVIAFGDNGNGMKSEELQLCLKLGYSGRYDDRKGIGRFGVGMTFGAISLCQKIEVYSRQKQGNWYYTYLDISNIDKDAEPGIELIEQKALPEDYKDLVGDVGTLVIWSKIDRIETKIKEDELKHNLGRIYRKFLGPQIIKNQKVITNDNQCNLYVNNEFVHAHDPLFVTKSTKFPDDETTEIDSEVSFDWGVHEVDAPTSEQKQGTITIRTSLLPESWRQFRAKVGRHGCGRSKDNLRRKIDENEGISILRHGREVTYRRLPFFLKAGPPEVDRFWSCEIDFDPVLDHWFSVKNIKIGARPLEELKKELNTRIKPSVERFREQIKKVMDEYDAKQNESKQGPLGGNKDKEDELNSITVPPPLSPLPVSEQEQNAKDAAQNTFPDDEKAQNNFMDKIKNNKYSIIETKTSRSDGPFIEIIPDLASKVVNYNMNHAFFRHMYEKIRILKEDMQSENSNSEDNINMIDEIKGYFDNLFFAYSEAYYDLDDKERAQKVGDTLDELMTKWNLYLRRIYKNIE